jgi:hypothetical protein
MERGGALDVEAISTSLKVWADESAPCALFWKLTCSLKLCADFAILDPFLGNRVRSEDPHNRGSGPCYYGAIARLLNII